MRHLVTIQKIKNLQSIEGADKIEVATIKGWKVVVKKGEFKIDDLCIYFEIDSFLPVWDEFKFLLHGNPKKMLVDGEEKEGIVLKTVKLRGQISQGLALPLSSFTSRLKIQDIWEEGFDITEKLGVYKYEQPIPASLSGEIIGSFPTYIPKTDEERLQNCEHVLGKYAKEQFYVTEKLDGTSCTVFMENDELHVCSRNWDLKKDENNTYWKVILKNEFEQILRNAKEILNLNLAFQGEIVGEGIQKNPLKIKGQEFYAFNIYDIDAQKYVGFKQFEELCKEARINTVPVVDKGWVLGLLIHDIDQAISYSTRKSVINHDVWVEGLIFRPIAEIIDKDLGRLSFKVISPQYLLKHNL